MGGGGGGGGGGGTLLNPLKIKPPIADFLYPPRGFNPPKIEPHFDFLTPKSTNAESGFENGINLHHWCF